MKKVIIAGVVLFLASIASAEKITVCDICGSTINTVTPPITKELPTWYAKCGKKDLCASCYGKVWEFMIELYKDKDRLVYISTTPISQYQGQVNLTPEWGKKEGK